MIVHAVLIFRAVGIDSALDSHTFVIDTLPIGGAVLVAIAFDALPVTDRLTDLRPGAIIVHLTACHTVHSLANLTLTALPTLHAFHTLSVCRIAIGLVLGAINLLTVDYA